MRSFKPKEPRRDMMDWEFRQYVIEFVRGLNAVVDMHLEVPEEVATRFENWTQAWEEMK